MITAGDSNDHRNWSETAVFRLAKYSRSISRPDVSCEGQPSALPVSRTTPAEWSHFSQTGLSLVVETVHVGSRENNRIGVRHQQIILKIIWDNNPSPPKGNLDAAGSTDRPGVFLLEKVNLTQVQETFGHSRQLEESPLKANCKDCVVGLRYATGYSDTSFTFNRIQIKLQTPADSFRLISIIETICPCKISSGIQNSQSSRSGGSQPPASLNSPGLSQNNNAGSQDLCDQPQLSEPPRLSKKNAHQGPTSTDSPVFCYSSQSTIEATKNPLNSRGMVNEVEALESMTSTESGPTPSQSMTRNLPVLAPLESRHTFPEDLSSLSDENLMECVRDIVMDPGFNSFVHRVKKLISHEH